MEELFDILYRNSGFDCEPWQVMMRMLDWELIPLKVGDRVAGVVAQNGTEVHVAIDEGYRKRFWRAELRDVLGRIINRYGYATTVTAGAAEHEEFVSRLGFKEDETCEGRTVWKMTRFKYA